MPPSPNGSYHCFPAACTIGRWRGRPKKKTSGKNRFFLYMVKKKCLSEEGIEKRGKREGGGSRPGPGGKS